MQKLILDKHQVWTPDLNRCMDIAPFRVTLKDILVCKYKRL